MIEPSFDTWTSIFLVVGVHGIVLAAVFFVRDEGRSLPNNLLGLFLLLFSLNLVSNVLYWTRYTLEVPHVMGIASSFHFLYGPVLFVYVLSVTSPRRPLNKWDLTHLVPFAIFVLWMVPFYIQPADYKAELMLRFIDPSSDAEVSTSMQVVTVVKCVLLLGYAAAISLLLYRKQRQSNRISDETFRWLRVVGFDFWGFVICFISYFVLVYTINFKVEYDYMISFGMSLFIFGIGYLGLFKPNYLLEAHNGRFKYESSTLDPEEAEGYIDDLLTYMEENKPYLDGDLKIDELAEQLSIPPHHLSQLINSRLEKNFFEFVNTYRVEEAKKMLADPDKEDFKILRVAFESGFNNKTTFNSAFKDQVGTTPSRFRKKQMNGN